MLTGPIATWIRPRLYHLLSPLVALALVGLLDHYTNLLKRFEDQTVNLRFQARSSFDPPADPRLVFVAIDEFSVSTIGKWPWPRTVEADFIKTVGQSGTVPHTVTFDVMFTESSDKLAKYRSGEQPVADPQDVALADAFSNFPSPSLITGALAYPVPADKAVAEQQEEQTKQMLSNAGQTVALSQVKGDIFKLKDDSGSDVANLPVSVVRAQSLFGFVNDDPDPVDDIRHAIPLVVRVQDKIYPSLALQTLCQMLNVDPDKVEVNLTGRSVRLTNSSGKVWNIPVDETGEDSD